MPANVPLVRLVDDGLTGGMTEYVVYHVLRYHRRVPELEQAQRRSQWMPLLYPLARDRKVGILGLGVLGSDAAEKLVGLGFDVAGWSRTRKSIPGVISFYGQDQLADFLDHADVLVADRHRHRHVFLGPLVPVVDVQVGAADGDLADLDQHVFRA